MLDPVQPGAVGEHPAGKDPLDRFLLVDLVDLGEDVGLRLIGRRARIANAGRDLQRAELNRLVERDLERDDSAGDLVEAVEHRGRIGDLVGVSRGSEAGERERAGEGGGPARDGAEFAARKRDHGPAHG